MCQPSQVQPDLLRWRPVRVLIKSWGFPSALQTLALTALVLLAILGFGVGRDHLPDELLTLRKTNITTLVVWGLWWPGMVLSAMLGGRVWCMVCPLQLVHRIACSLATAIGWPRAKLGKVARAGWLTIVSYLLLQLLVAGFSVHRVPHFTAVLLLALLGAAVATGLVFREPRSFCRAFCPASALLSVYGRHAPVQLESRNPSTCADCSTKDCVRPPKPRRLGTLPCPSNLLPFNRHPSDPCVSCLNCVKVCPHDNMGIGLVAASAPIRRQTLLKPFEAAFVMVALGFVAHEVTGEVKWLDAVFHSPFVEAHSVLPIIPLAWLEAVWYLLLFPFLAWGTITVAGYASGHRSGIRQLALAAATGAAPVVAIAHLAKATVKLTTWAGYLPLTLHDPVGLDTLRYLSEHPTQMPGPLVPLALIGGLMLGITVFGAAKSWGWARAAGDGAAGAKVGTIGATVLFTAVLSAWAFAPL